MAEKRRGAPRRGSDGKWKQVWRGSRYGVITQSGKVFAALMVKNGGNGCAALREMGYSPGANDATRRQHSHDFQINPVVQAEIARLEAQLQRKALASIDRIRHRCDEIMETQAKDRVPAMRLLAEMTPGAMAPREVKVDAKMTYAEMVLEAQRKREEEAPAVAPALEQPSATPAEHADAADPETVPEVEPAR